MSTGEGLSSNGKPVTDHSKYSYVNVSVSMMQPVPGWSASIYVLILRIRVIYGCMGIIYGTCIMQTFTGADSGTDKEFPSWFSPPTY